MLVVLSDGEAPGRPVEIVLQAQSAQVQIFAIGLGAAQDFPNLRSMASETNGTFVEAKDAEQLSRLFDDLAVSVTKGRVMVRARGSFDPPGADVAQGILTGTLISTSGGNSVETRFSQVIEIHDPTDPQQ